MATHFSILAWRIPGMGEPGGLLSMGLHRVGQHQGLFQGVSSSHLGAKELELQLQHQSLQRIFRTDFL